MSVFVDTSAFLAVLDAAEQHHLRARQTWQELLEAEDTLFTTSYVLLETFALVQRRLGMAALREFQNEVVPVLKTHWVGEELHAAGVAALLTADRRNLSLVDCVSFEIIRRLGLKTAFAFDGDFLEQGFECIPE